MAAFNLSFTRKLLCGLMLVLLVSAAYLYPFPQANLLYPAGVVIHVLGGILATALLALLLWRLLTEGNSIWKAGWMLIAAGAALGVVRMFKGTPHSEYRWLYAHIVVSVIGIGCLLAEFLGRRGWLSSSAAMRVVACLALLGALGGAARYQRESRWLSRSVINNPTLPPASMDGEGDGPKGPFFPSSAQVYGGQKIPSKFFMESESCKRCHEDIYKQWNSSAHHFSSFNNQWYRKSIEYMQDVVGTKPSKWCAGCHDHAVFFNGRFDRPIKEQVDTPEAQNGLGCVSCHSIAHVDGSVGNGGFTIGYPPLNRLASSTNPWIKKLDQFVTYLNPEPHRRTFMKAFMRADSGDSAEFCS